MVAQDASGYDMTVYPVLHTVHLEVQASYNLPFRTQPTVSGPFNHAPPPTPPTLACVNSNANVGSLVNARLVAPILLCRNRRCGAFELTTFSWGEYEIVAWHEGWSLWGRSAFDVLTQRKIQRRIQRPENLAKKVSAITTGAASQLCLSDKVSFISDCFCFRKAFAPDYVTLVELHVSCTVYDTLCLDRHMRASMAETRSSKLINPSCRTPLMKYVGVP